MDYLDVAQDFMEMQTERTIKEIRKKARQSLLHTGYCFNCNETVHSPYLYCDEECRKDYEERESRKRRQTIG